MRECVDIIYYAKRFSLCELSNMGKEIDYKWKKFDELSLDDLYAILNLRQKVFIVEQDCPYIDADYTDDQGNTSNPRILPRGHIHHVGVQLFPQRLRARSEQQRVVYVGGHGAVISLICDQHLAVAARVEGLDGPAAG